MDEEKTLPYDDDTMKYDFEEHRYILTPKYLLDKIGIDLSLVLNPGFSDQPQKLVEHYLDQISAEVYSWIYQFNRNNDIQEFLLATNPFLRKTIRNAMREQVLYSLRNGDLNTYSGVNVKTGQILDQRLLVQSAIAPNASRELNRIIPGVGVAITYQGQWFVPCGFLESGGKY